MFSCVLLMTKFGEDATSYCKMALVDASHFHQRFGRNRNVMAVLMVFWDSDVLDFLDMKKYS